MRVGTSLHSGAPATVLDTPSTPWMVCAENAMVTGSTNAVYSPSNAWIKTLQETASVDVGSSMRPRTPHGGGGGEPWLLPSTLLGTGSSRPLASRARQPVRPTASSRVSGLTPDAPPVHNG